jgi:hypothetical protein
MDKQELFAIMTVWPSSPPIVLGSDNQGLCHYDRLAE